MKISKITRHILCSGLALLLIFSLCLADENKLNALPERIILNLTQTPYNSQSVTWRTTKMAALPQAQIIRASQLLSQTKPDSKFWLFAGDMVNNDQDDNGRLKTFFKDSYAQGKFKDIGFFEKGEIKTQHLDNNEDGKPDVITTFEKTLPVEQKKDINFDGRFNILTRFSNGLLSIREKDINFDGKIDYFAIFDKKGQILKIREDTKKNGKIDKIRHYKSGEPCRIELDTDHNGFFETVSLIKNNKIVKTLIDKNQDGRPDMEIFFDEYQDKKRLISDSNFDGYFEITQQYDDPAWSMILSRDINADRMVDIRSFYTDTILRRKELDENADSFPDCIEIFNKAGLLEKIEEKKEGRTVITWFYDVGELLVRGEEDKNGDGITEIWYLYDKGNLKSVQEDTNYDGKPDLWEEYDETRAVVKREKDLDFDGMPDFVDLIEKTEKDS